MGNNSEDKPDERAGPSTSTATNAPPESAALVYDARLRALRHSIHQLSRRYRLLAQTEAALTLTLSIIFYALYTHAFTDRSAVTVVAYWAVSFFLLSIPGRALVRTGFRIGKQRRVQSYYEERVRRLDGTWKNHGDSGNEFSVIRHPYCLDLDLFGSGSLFEYLSSARTGGGRRWLADALLTPASLTDAISRQEAIAEIRDRNDLREYLAEAAGAENAPFEGDSLKEWVDKNPVRFETATHMLGVCLCLVNLSAIALGLAGRITLEAPLVTLAAVGLFTVATRGKIGTIKQSATSHVVYELDLLIRYAQRFRQERFTCSLLKMPPIHLVRCQQLIYGDCLRV